MAEKVWTATGEREHMPKAVPVTEVLENTGALLWAGLDSQRDSPSFPPSNVIRAAKVSMPAHR